ncbi:hexose transporter [Vararia minispora EC-137]|uniref:Hexose transporter n=1 Tax=Vararia minispora EC-137 TaxID=1314806 RepID=A0ACB8QHA6_9AGAM|nr:hexose transporter [Vararia minispora EC-137]
MAGGAVVISAGGGYLSLMDPSRKWYKNRRLIELNGWLLLCLITSSTNGYDGSMMNGLQSMGTWQEYFQHPAGTTLGLLNAVQNMGGLIAFPIAPYLSDGLGRRLTILIGAAISTLASCLQASATSMYTFIGARFLVGFGVAFSANAAPMLVTELAYPSQRATLTALYNSLWYSGAVASAWATYVTSFTTSSWSWRGPSLLQAIPSVLQLLLLWWCPESPRWLVSKGQDTTALQVLAHYHADGNEQNELVRFELEEIKAAIKADRMDGIFFSWTSLFSTPSNIRRLRIILAIAWFSQWSGNGIVSYYLTIVLDNIGIKSTSSKLLINGFLQTWNLFWACLASFLVERLGRRLLFISSAAGMTIFFSGQTISSGLYTNSRDAAAGTGVIVFIFLFYAAYDLAFAPLIVAYTVEILPFAIRAKGLTVFNFTVSLASALNQYINPVALKALAWKYYIFYCIWLIFELGYVYMFVVETKGLSLEETAALFDEVEVTPQLCLPLAKHTTHDPNGHESVD